MSGVVLLSRVTLALAGGHHCYLVGARASVLTLQLDPLCPSFINNAAPLLAVAAAPVPPCVAAAPDPVGQQVGWQTLPRAHQLFNGVHTGALTIGDVLGGS